MTRSDATLKSPIDDLDRLAIDTLRFLAVDMVEAARSGHPGAPLGQAPMAYLLWSRFLRHSGGAPRWPGRDRFVLSAGHASAMLYGLLHLFGYDLGLEELRRFRQLDSKTPGHPEYGHTPGVETTTGPLGQGFGNAVGLAIARDLLAARFDRPGHPIVDWDVWVIAGDGDLMEGVSAEAASLAGHQRLGALKVLWDDNRISIDGPTSLAFGEDVTARFAAYGWRIVDVEDGNDLDALAAALETARAERERPTLVRVRTVIGFGAPHKAGTAEAHGEPLGAQEAAATKRALGWPAEPAFHVPDEARARFAALAAAGQARVAAWRQRFEAYRRDHPDLASEFEAGERGDLPAGWDAGLPTFEEGGGMATREASGKALSALARALPGLVGGSADLTPSNKTQPQGAQDFAPSHRAGRYLRFGVREHAMGSALNGLALAGGLIPYGGTFLVFADYMRPPIRLAALMGIGSIFVFTHDSIFLGEDGPTHQPVEHLLALRAIPGLVVLRPADAIETVEAWRLAIERRRGPTALALTRQKVPVLDAYRERVRAGVRRGGYVLADADPAAGPERGILIATGSEVPLALEARSRLAGEGLGVRVVSLPSWELFAAQAPAYRDAVLPPGLLARLAVEAGTSLGWERWVGTGGGVVGIDGFGASAPAADLTRPFGFTPEAVADRMRALLGA